MFKAIHEKCQFEKMKVAKSYHSELMKKLTDEMLENAEKVVGKKPEFRNGFDMFRKGKNNKHCLFFMTRTK